MTEDIYSLPKSRQEARETGSKFYSLVSHVNMVIYRRDTPKEPVLSVVCKATNSGMKIIQNIGRFGEKNIVKIIKIYVRNKLNSIEKTGLMWLLCIMVTGKDT